MTITEAKTIEATITDLMMGTKESDIDINNLSTSKQQE